MRHTSFIPALAIASLVLVGCSPERAMYADRPFCASDIALTVSGGLVPSFTWDDGCRVWTLRVEDVATDEVLWSMGKDDESLDAPITYGELPAGAGEFDPARPLRAGVEYRALLVQRSEGGRVITETRFTP